MKFTEINKQQALRQLELLGFVPEKPIFFRFFYPASDPKKETDKGRKLDRLNWKQVESYQAQGRGAYLVINGGGHKNENVTQGRSIFIEHDHLDKEVQKDLWQSLSLPVPTFQVDTGGKSIHSYWVFEEFVPINQWQTLQKDLLEYSDGDRSIKNPARVMRLAGAWHISLDEQGNAIYNQSQIISDSGKKYSYEELRQAIPAVKTAPQSPHQQVLNLPTSDTLPKQFDQITIPVPQPVPLILCCRKEVRDWIATGVPQGSGRNDIAIKVGLELVAVENHLNSIGQPYSESGAALFSEYCHRSQITEKEKVERYSWCLNKNPVPSITPDGIDNCIKSWYWREHLKPEQENYQSGDRKNKTQTRAKKTQETAPKTPIEEVINAIDKILDQHQDKSVEQMMLLQLAKEVNNYSPNEIKAIAKQREQERTNEDYLEERKEELEQLQSLESEEYIPFDDLFYDNPKVANAFKNLCATNKKIQPQYFLAILSAVSSLLGVKVKIEVPVLGEFRSNLNIALVGESGEGKSITTKILLNPLYKLQQQILAQHQKEKEKYEQVLEIWETKHKDHRGPKPQLSEFITTSPAPLVINEYSREGIVKNHNENRNGLLIHQEELVSIKRAQNMYRQGKGDDRQFLNNLYDGGTISRALKSERIIIPETCVSILGGTQPDIILREMGDLSDPDGQWARYNFITGKDKIVLTNLNQPKIDLSSILENLYSLALSTQPATCNISSEGINIYQLYINQMELLRWKTLQKGLRAVYSKATGEVARIALALHSINCLLKGEPINPVIPAIAIKKAIQIKIYFIRQMLIVRNWGNGNTNSESGLPVAYREIQKIAQRIGKEGKYLTARMVQQARCGVLKDVKADKIKEIFKDMVRMGIANMAKVKCSIALVIDGLLLGEMGGGDFPNGGGVPPKPPTPTPDPYKDLIETVKPIINTQSYQLQINNSTHSDYQTLLPIVENVGETVGSFVGEVKSSLVNGLNNIFTFVENVGSSIPGFLSHKVNLSTITTPENQAENLANTEFNNSSTETQQFNNPDTTNQVPDNLSSSTNTCSHTDSSTEDIDSSNLKEIIPILNSCNSIDAVYQKIQEYPLKLWEKAIELLPSEKRKQIKTWTQQYKYTEGKFKIGQQIKYWDGKNWIFGIIERIINKVVFSIRIMSEKRFRYLEVPAKCVYAAA